MMRRILALGMAFVLAGCGDRMSAEPVSVVAQGNYDHLASCYLRVSRAEANDLEPMTMERLTDPDEIDVTKTLHWLWATPRTIWEITFQADGSDSTLVSYHGYHSFLTSPAYRVVDQLKKCGVELPNYA